MQVTSKGYWAVGLALALLMAATRFHHFGDAFHLADASYAVFFLGGLYLGRLRGAGRWLWALLLEAVLIDYYAITFAGISGWCVTQAYGFLLLAYAGLWALGRWYAPRHTLNVAGAGALLGMAALAGAAAFVIANVSFYLLAGYFGSMSAGAYTAAVAQYFWPYVAVVMGYVGLAWLVELALATLGGKHSAA